MNSSFKLIAVLLCGLSAGAQAQSTNDQAGLIGRRHAGADFTYDHFNGNTVDKALGAAAVVNLPLKAALDLGLSYSYANGSGDRYDAIDKGLAASLLTHRSTEHGTAYFAGTLGHSWHRLDALGTATRENGAFWGVRAGYEVPVARATAINAGLAYSDSFDSAITRSQALRYYAEANHWFSPDLAGVLSASYRQIKQAPDALAFTAGLRWAF